MQVTGIIVFSNEKVSQKSGTKLVIYFLLFKIFAFKFETLIQARLACKKII